MLLLLLGPPPEVRGAGASQVPREIRETYSSYFCLCRALRFKTWCNHLSVRPCLREKLGAAVAKAVLKVLVSSKQAG